MKKIRRKLRLNGLKFYQVFTGYFFKPMSVGPSKQSIAYGYNFCCTDDKYDLRTQLLNSDRRNYAMFKKSDVMLLYGKRLHDMLEKYNNGEIIAYYYDIRRDWFTRYEKIDDLVDVTYKDWLIERIAGL